MSRVLNHSRCTAYARALLAAAALSFSACSFIPEYHRPELPVTKHWPQESPERAAAAGESAALISWAEFFRSPALQEVVRTALEHNRDLRVAALRVEEARSLYRVVRADLFPSIDVGGGGVRQKLPEAVHGAGQGSARSSIYDASVAVTAFELDLFGRLRSESKAAVERYLATVEGHRAVTIALIAEAANAYLQLLADQKILAITEETLLAQEKSYELVARSFANGVASKLDLAQVRQAVERARIDREFFSRRVAQDRNALVLLMGEDRPELFSSGMTLDAVELMDQLPVGLPSEVLLLRPDVAAAEHLLRGENARIGAARAAFLPRLSLTGSYGYASSELSELFSGGAAGAWTFVPQITMPLFEGGRNIANLDLAHARKNIAVAQYEQRIQAAFRDVADELAARRTLGAQLRAQQGLVDAAQQSYDLSFARYRSGIDSFLAVLDAQRALFAAQQEQIDTQRQLLANLVNLYKALGGGAETPEAPDAVAAADGAVVASAP